MYLDQRALNCKYIVLTNRQNEHTKLKNEFIQKLQKW